MSGLIPLGDPDAIACEGDACLIPAPAPVSASAPAAEPA
jgi:hypothetical protein